MKARFLVLAMVLGVVSGPVWAESVLLPQPSGQRGYQARGCGFDMNRNGVIGEPADCNVGDGVTLDPDGDGVNEDILYVDCQNGSDSTGTGSPSNPYQAIGHAINQGDGPGDGAEDIIAFRGVCNEAIILGAFNGVTGTRTKLATGSEEFDFQYPTDPSMIIGWDFDNDGQYPPFDADDIAVLDGGAPNDFPVALKTSQGAATDNFELAHMSCTICVRKR